MKKAYERPEIQIELIGWTNDIITDSLGDGGTAFDPPYLDTDDDF